MSEARSTAADDRTEHKRRKNLTDEQLRELELAGGVEGGMQAGSAGGPGQQDAEAASAQSPDEPRR